MVEVENSGPGLNRGERVAIFGLLGGSLPGNKKSNGMEVIPHRR